MVKKRMIFAFVVFEDKKKKKTIFGEEVTKRERLIINHVSKGKKNWESLDFIKVLSLGKEQCV